MGAKRFFIAAAACVLALLVGTAGVVAWADPLMMVGKLEPGEKRLFLNERYEMAGLIREQDYSAVVMGTSLVANYRASWFTEGLGEETLKITFPDGRLSEFETALDLAFRTHPDLDTVFFGLDPNVLVREDQTSELPQYLYNENPLDDIQLYFNADSLALAVETLALSGEEGVTLDEAYLWDDVYVFSKRYALAGYPRPEESGTQLAEDAYLTTAEKNLDTICGWLEEHPDVRFAIWFPPYSILYWDQQTRLGTADAIITAVEYAARRLMAYDNAEVYCFLHNYNVIQNLERYTDHIHCSGVVSRDVTDKMIAGLWRLTEENRELRLEELREFVRNYDYDALFEDQDPQGEA